MSTKLKPGFCNEWPFREQKKYSRKDNVLVLNPPYDDRDEKFLSQIVVKLFVEK